MNNTQKLHPNLSNIDGTLASAVQENSVELKNLIDDSTVSAQDIKTYILELLAACKQTPWIKKAITRIEKMSDKNEIAFFIYNSFLSGENLKSI